MKASGSPPIYCFPLLYCLNFIAQFDSCHHEFWKIRLLKTKRKEKTTDSRLRDCETHPKRFSDFEIGPNFSETYVCPSTILYPYTFSTVCRCYGRKTGIFCLGPSRRVHKDPRLNSNRGHWVKFCVRKKLSRCKPPSKILHCSLNWIDCKTNIETYKVDKEA